MSAKKSAYCAMCLALAVVTNLIRIYSFPFGGSVTLCSMLFVMLPGWFFGFGYAAATGLLFGIINFMMGPYYVSFLQFLLDYIFAFSVMAVGAFFRNRRNGLVKGYACAVTARWIIASLAGLIWVSLGSVAWDGWSPLPYTMAYNGAYIFAEAAATIVLLFIPSVKNALERVKEIANK